ncbi:CBS domain-containing protein [bacterium (Candidatus Blackallbacteria) CG17_big_fil_post_rev_8_21_14_2_50_48_46]|uniref:CBS domain-containing protein n=1 Tax=bacterium (Candidatus Blackallbacteria) CG17_big_fil_post_rev_8_21_14_2_50_48_46 TaxID=2014261 RepID=A0A2M7FXV7_9BACT|nr:MAG: CBS domain-containing protein [bacterium (Candidatus Blackallbacteria) CG18_big_fil_WC_8_21_14_2_50_49_26]PIW14012.1 MAG: CBS domain-containing protein [bacterium (Candidatus Blackallbacteria) CG17_big_fil_post_rev_8_21_14_2_50_48_46]PIW46864.1 MAG: CBS domain-containing protein [bacterium (Candidatus Blackallbacteria) CG13_big_fil_rev_8_21_14_2_50_49_14]
MKKRESIGHIMSAGLFTVHPKQTLWEVKEIFEQQQIRHIPVVSGKDVVGIVSLTDLMRVTYGIAKEDLAQNQAIYQSVNVEQAMTPNPEVVSEETTIREVAELLVEKGFHAVPVVGEDGNLKGLVTTTDLIRYLIEQY